jgi:hypothetical protein
MTRAEQFAYIGQAKGAVLAQTRQDGIPLHRLEFVVPFVPDDLSLSVWVFFETDDQLRRARREGWSDSVEINLIRALRSAGYPKEWLAMVEFAFDSHEHVVRDYDGSYFYRLR